MLSGHMHSKPIQKAEKITFLLCIGTKKVKMLNLCRIQVTQSQKYSQYYV
jgi:hypothetical protein